MGRSKEQSREMRHKRVRRKVRGITERPRLCVTFSNRHIVAQIVDDTAARTIIQVTTLQKDILPLIKDKPMREAAKTIGQKIGEAAVKLGVTKVVFDKGGRKYGLRMSGLADAARESGLEF